MIRIAVVAALALSLSACLQTTQSDAPAVTVTPSYQFAKRCLDFYGVVSDLDTQHQIGGLSDDAADDLDPFIQAGHVICQDEAITDFGSSLDAIEETLASIARAQQEGGV